jgi:hypothetical protein
MADDPVICARALLGVPFRLHGRDPAHGLDCVGLILHCHCALADIPLGYALRGGTAPGYAAMFAARGLARRATPPEAGDIMLMQAGVAQFHLGLWCGDALIHADAMLRRVVETPGIPRWPLISAWYWPESVNKTSHPPLVSSAAATRMHPHRLPTSPRVNGVVLRPSRFNVNRHCEERSDAAIQTPERGTGLPRPDQVRARNDDDESIKVSKSLTHVAHKELG